MITKFDITGLEVSSRANMKSLKLPEHSSESLAYFCGLLAGDGHIGVRPLKGDYYFLCAGNADNEREFYKDVVCPLVKQLFSIDICPKGLGSNTYGIRMRSKTLVRYLTEVLGLPKNRKYDQLKIPWWVKLDEKLIINYIRGLTDTDFCLTLKKRYKSIHYYPVISGDSESKLFLKEVVTELEKLGFKISTEYDYKYEDTRLKKGYYVHQGFHIYGHTQLIKWMNLIGFYNPKHIKKFNMWKERNADSSRKKVISAINDSKKIEVAKSDPLIAGGGNPEGN